MIHSWDEYATYKSFFGTYLPQFEKEAKAIIDIMHEWEEGIDADKLRKNIDEWLKIRGPTDTSKDFDKWRDDKDKAANKGSRNSGAPAIPDFQALAVQSEKLSAEPDVLEFLEQTNKKSKRSLGFDAGLEILNKKIIELLKKAGEVVLRRAHQSSARRLLMV